MSKGIFITGTGTDIGKTYVTGLIVKKLVDEGKKATYYKAALSGAKKVDGKLVPGDAEFVSNMAGLKEKPEDLVSYVYERAVSPHLATKFEGNPLELDKVKEDFDKYREKYDFVVMEGSGGIICPIVYEEDKKILLEDIVRHLGLDIILIADAGLGTINSTVLTYKYLESVGIKTNGVILNNYIDENFMHRDNLKMIEDLIPVKVLATVGKNDKELNININNLVEAFGEV